MCSFAKTAGRCGGKSLLVLLIDTLRRHIFGNFPAEFDFCFCDSTELQMSFEISLQNFKSVS